MVIYQSKAMPFASTGCRLLTICVPKIHMARQLLQRNCLKNEKNSIRQKSVEKTESANGALKRGLDKCLNDNKSSLC